MTNVRKIFTGLVLGFSVVSSSQAMAAPVVHDLQCNLSNGVLIRAIEGSSPLSVSASFFGISKIFQVKISDSIAGHISLIYLSNGSEEYIVYLPVDRASVAAQRVRGEVRTKDLWIPHYYRLVASAVCEVALKP